MSFGLNRAQLIGRLGADVVVTSLEGGGRVANFSVATDESYFDRARGEEMKRTEWHRVVTFQDGLVDVLQRNGRKGRLVYLDGRLATRQWRRDGEDKPRHVTEIVLAPGCRVQFLERAPAASAPPAEASAA